MKAAVLAITILVAGGVARAADPAPAETAPAAAPVAAPAAGDVTALVKVRGMVCNFCAQGLEKAFKTRAGVRSVRVSLRDKLITLVLAPDSAIDDGEIRKVVEETGYNVVSVERRPAAPAPEKQP